MKVVHEILDIKDIIKHWVKDYEFKDGESLSQYDFYFDPMKGTVIFRLFINEVEDNQENSK